MMKKIIIGLAFLLAPLSVKAGTQTYIPSTSTFFNYQTNYSTAVFRSSVTFVSGSTTTFQVNSVLIINSSTTIRGTNTNDNAGGGFIGEYVSSTTLGNQTVGTSTQYFDILSFILTPGDWDLSGVCYYSPNGATVVYVDCGIGTVTGNSATGLTSGDTVVEGPPPVSTYQIGLSIPVVRKSIAVSTTYYLKGNVQYSVATALVRGRISARRIR